MSNENVTNQVLWLIMLKHECSGFNHALFFICSMRQAVRNKVPKAVSSGSPKGMRMCKKGNELVL